MKLLYHPAAGSSIAMPLIELFNFPPTHIYRGRWYWNGGWSCLAGCGLIRRLGIIRAVMILFSVIKYYLLYLGMRIGDIYYIGMMKLISNASRARKLIRNVQFVYNRRYEKLKFFFKLFNANLTQNVKFFIIAKIKKLYPIQICLVTPLLILYWLFLYSNMEFSFFTVKEDFAVPFFVPSTK